MSTNKKLIETIDRLVAERIRAILPDIMNEVLLKTIARAHIVTETTRQEQVKRPAQRPAPQKKLQLRDLLDEGAGAEFYERREEPEEEYQEPAPRQVARRYDDLPPMMQELLENTDELPPDDQLADDVPIRGLDFSGAKKRIALMESKQKKGPDSDDALRRAQFETERLERMRKALDKPVS